MRTQQELAVIKHYTEGYLAGRKPDFVEVAKDFVVAEFYRLHGRSDPKHYLGIAQKTAARLGLQETDIAGVHQTATGILLRYYGLTREQYEARAQQRHDRISLGGALETEYGEGLQPYVYNILERDIPLRRRIGDDRWPAFEDYVYRLLSGQELSRTGLLSQGLDIDEVRKKATIILRASMFEAADRRRALQKKRRSGRREG